MGKNVGPGYLKLDALERIDIEFHNAQKKSQLQPGDVVVVRIGQSGQAAKVPPELTEANCAGLVVIKGTTGIDADYLVHYLNSPIGRRASLKQTKGSTRQTLNTRSVAATKIPLPPLTEQKRIAKILDAADALRAKRRKSLAQLDTLIQATFLDMFGDPMVNPHKWNEEPLESIVSDTKLGLVRSSSEFGWDMDVPYVRMDAVTNDGRFRPDLVQRTSATPEEVEAFGLQLGDLLFNTRNSRELVGKVCLFDGPRGWVFNNNLMRIRFRDHIAPSVVAQQFRFERVKRELEKRKAGTTSVVAVYWKALKSLPILVPPVELQKRFTAYVEAISHQRTLMVQSRQSFDTLFESLQARAFAGEL